MGYRSFYRTYRPTKFDEIVGQEAIKKTLINALISNKIGHAYLFCGPRGTGKTTFARLFAKSLNCEEGIGHECNSCPNCLASLGGNHPDVYEIDAASNSGVDNVRELIEQVRYEPILGRYKVYIIDEVHSMTSSAFNALLKTLEEPPSNVIFILATTEPQKVLPTILSRVQRYDFSKLSAPDLVYMMKGVLAKEKVQYDESTLELIARLADGGGRDALSILEQVVSYGGEKISVEDVQILFGLVDIQTKIQLVNSIAKRDMKVVLSIIKEMYQKGADLVRLHDDLINIYKEILIERVTHDDSLLTILKPDEAAKIEIDLNTARRNIDLLVESRRNYRLVDNTYDHFELAILKMMATPLKDSDASQPRESTPLRAAPVVAPSEATTNYKVVEEKPRVETPVHLAEEKSEETALTPTTPRVQDDSIAHIDEEELINIMVQGDKKLKESILHSWGDLEELMPDPKLGIYANFLRNTTPRIVNNDVCIVESPLVTQVNKINSNSSSAAFSKVLQRCFNLEARVYSLTPEQYLKAVNLFRSLNQVGKLPKPKPIVIK